MFAKLKDYGASHPATIVRPYLLLNICIAARLAFYLNQ
jgi:hypothetical protein